MLCRAVRSSRTIRPRARNIRRSALSRPKVALRKYSRIPPGINLTEDFGIGEDGVPETIIIPGVAGEYATMFFKEAYKRGGERVSSAFEVELNVLTMSVRDDSDWEGVTTSPFFTSEQKEQTVREKCQALKLSPFFTNRLVTLLKNDYDITRLEQIRSDYEELMRSFRRERQVVLVTGKELSADELEFMKQSVKLSYLSAGDALVFSHQVDRNISGGLRLIIDGTSHDQSWTEKTISDTRTEADAEAYNSHKLPPLPNQLGVDPEVANLMSKYLTAAFSKEEVQQMMSSTQLKKA